MLKEEKIKSDQEKDYRILFHQKYKLAEASRYTPWGLSYCVIEDGERVLFQAQYRLNCTDDKGWWGQNWFHFYIVEKDGKKYCKFVDVSLLEHEAEKICNKYFNSHVSWCETIKVGRFVPEYKNKVIERTLIIELDDEINDLFESISKIDFEKSYLELFDCKYDISLLQFDCYDFVNRHVFHADGYCLEKYRPYIDLINYIFSKSNYKYLNPSLIKCVSDLKIAIEEMVKVKEEQIKFEMNIK